MGNEWRAMKVLKEVKYRQLISGQNDRNDAPAPKFRMLHYAS